MTTSRSHQTERPQTRRVFFAAQPDSAARSAIAEALQTYPVDPDASRRLRWLDAAGWHVTLRFVGNVSPELLPALQACISAIERFTISFATIEPFPSARRPLVLAVTGSAAAPGQALAETLEHRCRALALPPVTRPWRPHLSVARVRGRRSLRLSPQPLELSMRVSRFVLMESVQEPSGNRYVPLDPIPPADSLM
ncbi:MAG: RNA 2',3'-cyclic phosphodiesterase [Pseudomonadota bacterium]